MKDEVGWHTRLIHKQPLFVSNVFTFIMDSFAPLIVFIVFLHCVSFVILNPL